MDIGETLRFFRKSRGLKQKEMLAEHEHHSSYSRIESNLRDLRIKELEFILDRLAVSMAEFVAFTDMDRQQLEFRELYAAATKDVSSKQEKEELLVYYNTHINNAMRTVQEWSNLISIKIYFSQFWEEVSEVTDEDIDAVYNYLSSVKEFFQYDLILMSNLIHRMSVQQRKHLIQKVFPIRHFNDRDTVTVKAYYQTLTNVITISIYENKFAEAKRYLSIAFEQEKTIETVHYHLSFSYLRNIVKYLETGEVDFLNKVYSYIAVMKDAGYTQHAEVADSEVKRLIHQRGKIDNFDIHYKDKF